MQFEKEWLEACQQSHDEVEPDSIATTVTPRS
jgi:hypothetical protein